MASGCGKTQPAMVCVRDMHRRAVVVMESRQPLESHNQDGQRCQPDMVCVWDLHRRAVVVMESRQSLESHEDQDGQMRNQMMIHQVMLRECLLACLRLDKKMQQQATSSRKGRSGSIEP